jgi:hypothetical protein
MGIGRRRRRERVAPGRPGRRRNGRRRRSQLDPRQLGRLRRTGKSFAQRRQGDGVVGAGDLNVVRANWGAYWAAAADALFNDLGKGSKTRVADEAPVDRRLEIENQ